MCIYFPLLLGFSLGLTDEVGVGFVVGAGDVDGFTTSPVYVYDIAEIVLPV